MTDVLVVGGGAAGFFGAIACAEARRDARVTVVERGAQVLAKVKISGGGRCNVTHACFDPAALIQNYPRGGKALLGPFHKFQPRDTVRWFESRGVRLKTEDDGRMFPMTDESRTIVDALAGAARDLGVRVRRNTEIESLGHEDGRFRAVVAGETLAADRLLLATGGGRQGHLWAKGFGHVVEPPVPSLFTFTVKDPRLEGLSGLSVENAEIRILETGLRQRGPLLITHWGLSGPAVLRLSAWGARHLHGASYQAGLAVNWTGRRAEEVDDLLEDLRTRQPRRLVGSVGLEGIPQRLWERLAQAASADQVRWADLTRDMRRGLAVELVDGRYRLAGKGAFKEEFVTAGGVRLDEVDFRRMESRIRPGLHFAGEILDIDGLTGGFNFQAAWTTGWLAGRAMAAGEGAPPVGK